MRAREKLEKAFDLLDTPTPEAVRSARHLIDVSLEELAPLFDSFDKFGPLLRCERCGHRLLDSRENLDLDVLGDSPDRAPVGLEKQVHTHVRDGLFDCLKGFATLVDWTNLTPGDLLVVDFFEDLTKFRLLACLRNDDGTFMLLIHLRSDGPGATVRNIELDRLPLNDAGIVAELKGLGFHRGVDFLTSHEPTVAQDRQSGQFCAVCLGLPLEKASESVVRVCQRHLAESKRAAGSAFFDMTRRTISALRKQVSRLQVDLAKREEDTDNASETDSKS